ncbi:MAG: rRNA maturation RNase YbeY [Sphingobacteriales bacterium]|nr:rRNA maturation RNase YbeY [Sphingobacteriales bacterium]
MAIQFFFADKKITLTERTRLKAFIEKLFKHEKKQLLSLTYVFCSDDYLLTINQQFLKHDYYTDIITFDLSATKGEIEGELYISVDRVRDNAAIAHVTVKEELHRVIFHVKKMRSAEERYLTSYFN